jgi:O-acetyl-ADP-ribose deacetylase (regulator of RNase III)
MGAGLAKLIKEEFPQAYFADLATKKGDMQKLGSFSYAHAFVRDKNIVIINAYTQYGFSRKEESVSYDAIRMVFSRIKAAYSGKKIGYPAIGAGLAGGDWNIIYEIICEELKNENHTYVEYTRRNE